MADNEKCHCGSGEACPVHENLTPKQHFMIYNLEDIDELFYGGQAGGAKTEGLLRFVLRRRMECPGSVGLMMRKTLGQLEKTLIRKSKKIFNPYAKWREQKKQWLFRNGSIEECGYCENDNDVYQYDSAEYDDICIDEARHTTEFQLQYLCSRLRTSGEWKTLLRVFSNPGGVGHIWLKERFVRYAKNRIYKVFDEEEGTFKTRYFLPASLEDNTMMPVKKRKEYRAWLNGLPEAERRMLRDGDWDFVYGAAFSELKVTVHQYNPKFHPVPKWAKIAMSYDFGFGAPFSIGWWWLDFDGRAWRFAEWYGWNGKPNIGLRMSPSLVGKEIHKLEEKMDIKGRVVQRVADPAIFAKNPNLKGGGQGPSVAEMFSEKGVHFLPGDNDRMLGKQQFHDRLRVPDDYDIKNPLTNPMMMISSECKNWWRTVPMLSTGDWGTPRFDDIEDKQEDHAYDETRYFLMSRPIRPEHGKPKETFVQKIMKKVKSPRAIEEDESWFKPVFDY